MDTLDDVWHEAITDIMSSGQDCQPRGNRIKELLSCHAKINMNYPVLICPTRKLNYRFMAAEAAWIVSGSDKLAELTPYNSRMAEFSDDGERLAGAYGPRFLSQLHYVAKTLAEDRDTRRATLTLWTPNPAPSFDIPCTVAVDFKLRNGYLSTHIFMRSSDVWLGLPYDVFSFTMMTCAMLERLAHLGVTDIGLGNLYLTMASSHLYEENIEAARDCLGTAQIGNYSPLPSYFYHSDGRNLKLIQHLYELRDNPNTRWWKKPL